MPITIRAAALLTALGLAACAPTPGPIELQAGAAQAECHRGNTAICEKALMLTNMAQLEHAQRQREADEAGKAVVGGVALVLGILAGAHH
jgi:hypothetical protein